MHKTGGITRRLGMALAAFALAAIAIAVVPACAHAGTIETVHLKGTVHQTEARSMLAMVNQFRTTPITDHSPDQPWYWASDNKTKKDKTGLKPLKWSYKLEKIALQRAKELAIRFSHESPKGDWHEEWLHDGDWDAENIAAGQLDACEAFIDWREDNENSSGQGHRKNMLKDCTSMGVACVEDENGVKYWAMELGCPYITESEISAEDGPSEWDCDIDTSLIESIKAKSPISLQVGDTITSPEDVAVRVKMNDGWPNGGGAELTTKTPKDDWTTSNTKVVSVSNGTIKALSVGTATLKTTVLGHELSVPVTVTRRDAGLSLPATKTMTMGSPYKLDLTKVTDGKLAYESSDASVAKVSSDGTVTPVAPGKATITVRAARTETYEAATASLGLTVRAKSTPLVIDVPDTLYVDECGSFDFECPSTSYVEWSSSDDSVLGTNASQWFTLKEGVVTVTASVPENDCWPAVKASKQVKVVAKKAENPVSPTPGETTNPTTPKPPSPSVNPTVTPAKPAAKPSTSKVSAPKGTSLTKVSKAKKAFTAKWKKASGVKGYQLRWSAKSNMSGAKSATVKSAKTASKKVSKLKKKTKYYVQVRTYKVVDGKTYWSGWSKAKSVRTK